MESETYLNETIGTIFIGLAATAILYGVSHAQAAWYYKHYPRDRAFLKYLVAIVCFLDTLNLAFYFATMWQYLVEKGFGTPALPWTSDAQIVLNACSITIIQSFYVFRIWTLSRDKMLTGTLGTMVAADLALGLLLFEKSASAASIAALGTLTEFDVALNAVTLATDGLICAVLVTLLARSRTGSAGAKRLINRLVFYTINTGLLTTVCSVLTLVTVLVLPTSALYVMFYYIGSRLYSISMLATLNAREGLRHTVEQNGTTSIPEITSSHSFSRRSVRQTIADTLHAVSSQSNREILVAIQRDTTVTFEEQDKAAKQVFRKGPYRYGKPSAPKYPTVGVESRSDTVHDSKPSSIPSPRSL